MAHQEKYLSLSEVFFWWFVSRGKLELRRESKTPSEQARNGAAPFLREVPQLV